jgi:hypothetical protein
MPKVEVGETILLPVESSTGAFAGECFITFDTLDGPVSGFIRADQVRERNKKHFLEAEVIAVASNCLTVRLHGSFFTTTGLAHIDKGAPYLLAA